MCGIAGIVGPAAVEATLVKMLARIAHRGETSRQAERLAGDLFAVGTNRLAIVDPAGGAQPFATPDGTVVCIANGEIYNAPALRRELAGFWSFRTTCDTEVVLASYLRWGEASFARLRGMFAVAIVEDGRRVVLARDPLGIKPLYVAEHEGSTWFASEVKALAVEPSLRIAQVAPGSVHVAGRSRPFWQVPAFGASDARDRRTVLAGVAEALTEAVRAHLPEPGRPLACLLSGGVDSSTVTHLAHALHEGPVEAWTLAIGDGRSEDRDAAEALCRTLDIPLHVVSPTEQELTRIYLERGVWMTETWEPALVRNAVSYHVLCREVRRAGHALCLSGEGADEVFGGYAYLDRLRAEDRDRAIRRSLVDVHRTYLQMADRASMAATLEVRVPFLDATFVDHAATLPPWARSEPGRNKVALREAFPAIPAANRERAKIGMNAGAGFGSNDPGDGIYYRAVRSLYETSPERLARDRGSVAALGAAHGVDGENLEEVFDFARWVEHGFHNLVLDLPRPQLNTTALTSR